MRATRRATMTLALVLAAAMSAAVAPAAAGPLRAVDCGKLPKGVREGRDIRCVLITVPLRHGDAADPRTLRVAVSIVRADRRAGKPPLIVLGGGPGEPIAAAGPSAAAPRSKSALGRLNNDRDLVLVEQRGAGRSRPALGCVPETTAATPQLTAATTDAAIRDALIAVFQTCAQRLTASGADLAAFTTEAIASDLDAVRRALRIRQADVLANSYGTKIALVAASRPSSWIRRIVLSSTIQPGTNFATEAPANFARALRVLNTRCAAAPRCRARFGDLEARLERALTSLEASPLTNGKVTLTAALASTAVYQSFYTSTGVEQLPAFIGALAKRDRRLLQATGAEMSAGAIIAQGQQYAVLCSEELAGLTAASLLPSLGGFPKAARLLGVYQTTVGAPAETICDTFVPAPPPPSSGPDLSQVKQPVLIVSGVMDQTTPPAYGVAVAKALPRSRHVVLPTGHSPVFAAGVCGIKLLSGFLSRPAATLPRCRGVRLG